MGMQNRFVIVGLGSNQNSLYNLRRALLKLRVHPEISILKVSRIYESKAQLPSDAPAAWDIDYLNAAVLMEVKNFNPQSFLGSLKKIEKDLGRSQTGKWAPRSIDLDILYVHDFEFQSENLTIPHPLLFKRPFAWRPALEVWPFLNQQGELGFDTRISEKVWPELVAILNVTPDSFSDGGFFLQEDNFLKHAQSLLEEGADYLDIGAESTRHGAEAVSTEEEKRRLVKAFKALEQLRNAGLSFKTSLDSRNFESIQFITEHYLVDMINDVSGLSDQRILALAQKNRLKTVCMHSLTVPADKTVTLSGHNPVQDIENWWQGKINEWKNKDLNQDFIAEDIIFDPGFGFGKTTAQSQYVFNYLKDLRKISQPFLLGYSRKSFLNYINDRQSADKDLETSIATTQLNIGYAQYLRVHDVRSQKIALRMSHGL